jgi:hypothetical protein
MGETIQSQQTTRKEGNFYSKHVFLFYLFVTETRNTKKRREEKGNLCHQQFSEEIFIGIQAEIAAVS